VITLYGVAAVSFILTIGFFAGAIAVAGGPFNIDEHLRFHREDVSDTDVPHRAPLLPPPGRRMVL